MMQETGSACQVASSVGRTAAGTEARNFVADIPGVAVRTSERIDVLIRVAVTDLVVVEPQCTDPGRRFLHSATRTEFRAIRAEAMQRLRSADLDLVFRHVSTNPLPCILRRNMFRVLRHSRQNATHVSLRSSSALLNASTSDARGWSLMYQCTSALSRPSVSSGSKL